MARNNKIKNKIKPSREELVLGLIKDFEVGVEVGTLKGDFAKKILSQWKGKLYIIDAWRRIPGLVDFNNPDHNGHLDNMAHAFMNIYEFGERAVIIRDLSVSASKLFSNNSLDFAYIDAGHDKISVKEDLKNWYPKIKKGGLIIGDDYFDGLFHLENIVNSTTLVEVKSTVDKFAKSVGKKLYFSDATHPSLTGKPQENLLKQWWIKK